MAALNAEIPELLKRRLSHAVTDRGTTLKVAVAEAIELWISGPVGAAHFQAEGIPTDKMALVHAFLEAYESDPIFRTVVQGIMDIRARKK